MAHGDPVGDRDRAEFAWCAAGGSHALLHRLRLAHERDVAGRRLIPAGRDADQGLMDLLLGKPHRIEVRAMRRTRGAFGNVPAGQFRLVDQTRVHPETRFVTWSSTTLT